MSGPVSWVKAGSDVGKLPDLGWPLVEVFSTLVGRARMCLSVCCLRRGSVPGKSGGTTDLLIQGATQPGPSQSDPRCVRM